MLKYVDITEKVPGKPRSVLTKEQWAELLEWETTTTGGAIEALQAMYPGATDDTIFDIAFNKVFSENFRVATTKEIADWEAYNA